MPFAMWTRVGSQKYVLGGVQILPQEWAIMVVWTIKANVIRTVYTAIVTDN